MPEHAEPAATIPLSQLPQGAHGRVAMLEGKDDVCQRLREMGFCESAVICRIGGERSLVCDVCGTRVALHRILADRIHVEQVWLGR
jgi:ferrous iron transport protein A